MVVSEMLGLVYFAFTEPIKGEQIHVVITAWVPPVLAVIVPPVLSLFFSLLFRITTIVKTNEGLLMQRFVFLGHCAPTHPPYTPASILLNRSLARPLVRGESKFIIVARAVVLSCIGIGVPAFGIYVTLIEPTGAKVSTTLIQSPRFVAALPGNATIAFVPDNSVHYSHPWDASVTAALHSSFDNINCSMAGDYPHATAICRYAWSEIQTISLSVVVPSEAGFLRVWIGCLASREYACDRLLPIPLLPGSSLFGFLAWSQRQTVPQSEGDSNLIFSPEVYGLQQNTSVGGNITSLTLSVVREPIRYFQDTADASALSGIATFGGFWTFVNGTFALFFGANIVYFAFGRRPLSALGVVHLFQRRALVRKWYEDFPAIQTEGSLPGSDNAGIVAFIRERLVDLGEDPRNLEQKPRVKKVRPKSGKFRRALPWRKTIQRFNPRVQSARTFAEGSPNSASVHITASPTRPLAVETHDFATSHPEVPESSSRRGHNLDEIPLLPQKTQESKDTFSPRT
ncbi:hypothetical protein C8R45DRAFT_1019815 [Mycena sanguinolenta]|nr:hypothetical protein C8R45DRAFT_1019815 [Mycena sanguinolenta]